MLTNSVLILKSLQYPNGLFSAASFAVNTGYNKAWIRDNIYASLGFEAVNNYKDAISTYRALLDIIKKHEFKIDWMIKQPKPKLAWRYIHARYDPITGKEFWDSWGNKQNDAIGAMLFKIGDLESKGIKVLKYSDREIIQKLVNYLAAIEYWQDPDNGVWEEKEELHASSIGACVAGLKSISRIADVPPELISKGEKALHQLLPCESKSKKVDLALLSLIYPYNIVTEKEREIILKNVEEQLVRERGVIRYLGDLYYNKGLGEPEWTMGLPWLAIIYKELNIPNKYAFYMRKTMEAMNERGELPELYYANSKIHNENTPLGWAQSLYIVASTA